MTCPNCNNKINNESKYCPRCGKVFEKGDVKKYSEIHDTELMEIYYPNKNKKFKIWGISLRYTFFTYIYAIYKKMYLCAILSIISLLYWWYIVPRFIYSVFNSYGFSFYPLFYTLEATAFIYFYYIFMFDKILLNKRKKKLNKIIANNRDKNKEEIEDLIKKDNKDNKKGMIIAIIISLIVIPILIKYYFIYKDMFSVQY